jgi:hypothetical protein
VAARQASGFSSRYGSYRPTAQARPDAVPEFVEEIYDLTLRRPEHGIQPSKPPKPVVMSTPLGSPSTC